MPLEKKKKKCHNVNKKVSHYYDFAYYVIIMTDFFIVMRTFMTSHYYENLSHDYDIVSPNEILSHNCEIVIIMRNYYRNLSQF